MNDDFVKIFQAGAQVGVQTAAEMVLNRCASKWWHRILPCQCLKLSCMLKEATLEVSIAEDGFVGVHESADEWPDKIG